VSVINKELRNIVDIDSLTEDCVALLCRYCFLLREFEDSLCMEGQVLPDNPGHGEGVHRCTGRIGR
jgi:hypothetical protein